MVDTKKLEAVASRLNKESDSLNDTIQKIEDKLNGMRIGLEVWNEDELDSELLEFDEDEESPYGGTTRRAIETWLGYGRVSAESWGLKVQKKAVYYRPSGYASLSDTVLGVDDYNRSIHLVNAPREIRIKALGKMQGLIDNLYREAENAVDSITKARKLATDL